MLDANLLVYAHTPESPLNEGAGTWFENVLNGEVKVGLPWPTLLAFMRLMGNPIVVRKPLAPSQSWPTVAQWLVSPKTWIPLPTDRHTQILATLLDGESRADIVSDAHIAALAIEHGLTVCSTDGDFARFQGVRWENPLTGAHS